MDESRKSIRVNNRVLIHFMSLRRVVPLGRPPPFLTMSTSFLEYGDYFH